MLGGGQAVASGALPEGIAIRPVSSARILRSAPWAVCMITAIAAALRFAEIDDVHANLFYDAAVRSMSMSWHNFFFGAFDPAAILSIDKPPLDLWLQVASVKVFGWNSFALKLPEVLAGTWSVPLLYDAVRRAVGRPAGLASATVLALAPASVLTARSDTMDSVMMLLVIAALWLTVRATKVPNSRRSVVLVGVALGLAFNVKLLEGLIVAPALLILYALAAQSEWRRKLADVLVASLVFVAVALSWAVVASLAPGSHPWSIGSSDGTVWNAMFVFNGVGRVSAAATSVKPGGPGLLRLVESSGWDYNVLFGCVLVAALAIGIAAAAVSVVRARADTEPRYALPRAFVISLAVWIAASVLVFDSIGTLHTRYLEALSPAVAVAIGYGAVTLAGLYAPRSRPGMPAIGALVVALACVAVYSGGLAPRLIASGVAAMAVASVGAALLVRIGGRAGQAARWLTAALIIACAMAFPVHESLVLVRSGANDSAGLAVAQPGEVRALSRFLEPRTVGVHYELAVDEPLALAPLIIRDQRPILPLTSSFIARPLVGLARLQAAVQSGAVRYGLVGASRCGPQLAPKASCTPAALWIRDTGIDVTSQVGLRGRSRLYLLVPPRAG